MTGKTGHRLVLATFTTVALVFNSTAQSRDGTGSASNKENPCAVDPDSQERPIDDSKGLTATLEHCNGVLVPEKTGDTGIVAPAPDVGETPVIVPEDVPPQSTGD